MADSKKTIAVVGATGAQGGGLVRSLLADRGAFSVRAITRDPKAPKAQELAKMGAEVVAADLYDVKSLEKAFAGADGAFCVTFFWAHMSTDKEKTEANNMAKACKAANVGHVIWSTLEDTRKLVPLTDDRMPTLGGHYKVPHFDAKGESNQVFAELGLPTTFLHTSFYWDNFIHFGMGPKKGEDGKLALTLPMGTSKLAGMAGEDIGKCAHGVFKKGKELVGKHVGIAGEHLTGAQMAAAFTKALGQEVRYQAIEPAVFRSFGFPGADDLGNMFQVYRDFEKEVCGLRDLAFSRSLNPALQTFEAWLAQNKGSIPLG